MADLTLTFLGTGTSNGIPMIGCHCPVCTSSDPRDRRTRTSAVIRDHADDKTYLIDTATELRVQALAVGLERVDAVLLTHGHADHTSGLDDLRRFNEIQQERIRVFANATSAQMLMDRFGYAFTEQFPFYGGKPDLEMREVSEPFCPFGREIIPIPVQHGRLPILGFRIGSLGYVTDAKTIPDSSMELLRGLDVLVLNALRERPHVTHLSLSEALEVIAELKPKRAYLVHLSHEMGLHAEVSAKLPPDVQIAYDGLTVEID